MCSSRQNLTTYTREIGPSLKSIEGCRAVGNYTSQWSRDSGTRGTGVRKVQTTELEVGTFEHARYDRLVEI